MSLREWDAILRINTVCANRPREDDVCTECDASRDAGTRNSKLSPNKSLVADDDANQGVGDHQVGGIVDGSAHCALCTGTVHQDYPDLQSNRSSEGYG